MSGIWYIYKITGNCGRAYVGVTKRGTLVRWRAHMSAARNGEQSYLYNAIRKYGEGWFTIQTLCECYSAREAKTCERAAIAAHGTYAHAGNGFNLTYGGDGNWGWKPSTEVRAKIGAKSAERLAANPEYLDKMISGHKGDSRKRPTNAKRAAEMGRGKRGISLSVEHKAKIAAAGVGRKPSPETIAKMKSARPKGVWKPSAEAVAKMAATKRGRKLAPPHAAKVAAALKAVSHLSHTPEAKQKSAQTRLANGSALKAAERTAKRNSDPAFKHELRIIYLHEKALADRIGRPRAARFTGVHVPENRDKSGKMRRAIGK